MDIIGAVTVRDGAPGLLSPPPSPPLPVPLPGGVIVGTSRMTVWRCWRLARRPGCCSLGTRQPSDDIPDRSMGGWNVLSPR